MADTARSNAEVCVAMVPMEGQGEAEHLIPAHEPEGSPNLLLRRVSVNKLKVLSETGSKDLMSFYVRQNDILDCQVEMDSLHSGEYTGDMIDEEDEQRTRFAMNLSFGSNILLLFIRITMALSGSLSLLVATLDAALDVLSGFILWFTNWSVERRDKYRYPIGKARMEPLGIIVFSSIMGTAGFSIVMEGIRQLIARKPTELPALWIVVGGSVIVVVMKLFMYLLCCRSKNRSVQAFALDHLNDVIVNSVGLAGALLGDRVASWMDPATAALMSVWLIWAWGKQAHEHIMGLVGLAASPEYLQKLTYLALHHSPKILKIDTVRAYTQGSQWFAEVDIVLPADMSLKEAHDVGESLQIKLERLPELARAFVHLDYETSHTPEHKVV